MQVTLAEVRVRLANSDDEVDEAKAEKVKAEAEATAAEVAEKVAESNSGEAAA